jgi:hypothetical protein
LKTKHVDQDSEKLEPIKAPITMEEPTFNSTMKSTFSVIQFDVLKNPNFILWCVADIAIELSYYTPLFFLPCKYLINMHYWSYMH